MIFIARFMNSFLHQASFATGYWCYDRHRSVRLVVLVGLAIDQIAQSGLSSLSVIYYSAQLFSRRGNCHDNAVAESFFQLLKRERIKKKLYGTREEARSDIFDYIEMFYNSKRRHGSNNQMSPTEYENQYYQRLGSV